MLERVKDKRLLYARPFLPLVVAKQDGRPSFPALNREASLAQGPQAPRFFWPDVHSASPWLENIQGLGAEAGANSLTTSFCRGVAKLSPGGYLAGSWVVGKKASNPLSSFPPTDSNLFERLRMLTTLCRIVCGLAVTVALAGAAFAQEAGPGFTSLFDGKSLEGWDGDAKFWSVKDGAIVGRTTKENPTPQNTFLIWRKGEVSNFVLTLNFKIKGGNSGIQYRSKDLGNHVVGGYQADFEAGKTYSGILYEERESRGIMAERGQVMYYGNDGSKMVIGSVGKSDEIQSVIKPEDWNRYMIVADGHRLTHFINDRMTIQVYDVNDKERAKSGILALQLHAGDPMEVQFKDIQMMEIPDHE